MSFVQIIEFETDDIDAFIAEDRIWWEATEGKRTLRRSILTRDRNQPNRYRELAFFDSYESAMENSSLPETQSGAEKMQTLTRNLTYADLEVISDRS